MQRVGSPSLLLILNDRKVLHVWSKAHRFCGKKLVLPASLNQAEAAHDCNSLWPWWSDSIGKVWVGRKVSIFQIKDNKL